MCHVAMMVSSMCNGKILKINKTVGDLMSMFWMSSAILGVTVGKVEDSSCSVVYS